MSKHMQSFTIEYAHLDGDGPDLWDYTLHSFGFAGFFWSPYNTRAYICAHPSGLGLVNVVRCVPTFSIAYSVTLPG